MSKPSVAQDRTRIVTVPNLLSAYRIAITPVIVGLIFSGHRTAFAALVIVSFITDAFDGLIARHWHQETDLGAKLDSYADLCTDALALCGLVVFEWPFLVDHRAAFILMIGFYLASQALSLVRFHHLINMHLYSSKAMSVILCLFFILYFAVAYIPAIFYGMIAFSILNNIEEIVVLCLLPERRSNVRGLYWVLRERRRSA
jgi:CDP-diacylglycerol--glycerol-3-phosphate 3-phosphatidyltransferase